MGAVFALYSGLYYLIPYCTTIYIHYIKNATPLSHLYDISLFLTFFIVPLRLYGFIEYLDIYYIYSIFNIL